MLVAFKQEDPTVLNRKGKFVLPKGVTSKDYLPNTLIVKFKKSGDKQINSISSEAKKQLTVAGVNLSGITRLFPTTNKTEAIQSLKANNALPDLSDIYMARYEGSTDIVTVINALLEDQQIIYAEPSYIYKTSFVPNDPGYVNQSYLTKVMAPQAWDILKMQLM